MPKAGHIGIRDVARAAGVSVTTVSHALNDKPGVSHATRVRVKQVATELGYRPDPRGRHLASGRSGLVALTVSAPHGMASPVADLGHDASVMNGIAAAVGARDLALVIVPSGGDEIWKRLPIDAVIVVDPAPGDPALDEMALAEIPVATIGRPVASGSASRPVLEPAIVVDNDYGQGTRAMLDHLVERGAETVGVVSLGAGQSYEVDSVDAYRTWSRERGSQPSVDTFPLLDGDEMTGSVARAVADRLDRPGLPDAFYCLEEGVAASLLTLCRARGISVPGDLLVSSISDRGQAETTSPTLTTLELHPRVLGATAARALADLLSGTSSTDSHYTVPTTVVARGSTSR